MDEGLRLNHLQTWKSARGTMTAAMVRMNNNADVADDAVVVAVAAVVVVVAGTVVREVLICLLVVATLQHTVAVIRLDVAPAQ